MTNVTSEIIRNNMYRVNKKFLTHVATTYGYLKNGRKRKTSTYREKQLTCMPKLFIQQRIVREGYVTKIYPRVVKQSAETINITRIIYDNY